MLLIYLQADYCEENTDASSTPAAVRLQSLEPAADPESSPPSSTSQYAAIYQALDPKSLDWAGFILFWS